MAQNMKGGIIDEQGKMNNFAIEPNIVVEENTRVGFTEYAEKFNGRAAMIGFVAALALELTTGQGVLHFFGLL